MGNETAFVPYTSRIMYRTLTAACPTRAMERNAQWNETAFVPYTSRIMYRTLTAACPPAQWNETVFVPYISACGGKNNSTRVFSPARSNFKSPPITAIMVLCSGKPCPFPCVANIPTPSS